MSWVTETFIHKVRLQAEDINHGGHLGNDRVLTLCHHARISFLQNFKLTEKNIGQGVGIILTEAHIKYKAEGFLGDEIGINLVTHDFKNASFKIRYVLLRSSDKVVIAEVETQQAGFDYTSRKVALLPRTFTVLFNA